MNSTRNETQQGIHKIDIKLKRKIRIKLGMTRLHRMSVIVKSTDWMSL